MVKEDKHLQPLVGLKTQQHWLNTACIVQSAKIELFLSIASHLITVLTYRPIRIDRRSSLINADLESSFMIFVFEVFFFFLHRYCQLRTVSFLSCFGCVEGQSQGPVLYICFWTYFLYVRHFKTSSLFSWYVSICIQINCFQLKTQWELLASLGKAAAVVWARKIYLLRFVSPWRSCRSWLMADNTGAALKRSVATSDLRSVQKALL